jgi:hypothetical protein
VWVNGRREMIIGCLLRLAMWQHQGGGAVCLCARSVMVAEHCRGRVAYCRFVSRVAG